MARDHEADTFARTSGNTSFAAFLTDATGDVQVNVSRAVETGGYIVVNVSNGGERRVNKTVGNVSVSYVKRGPQGPRVLRALALLREARPHD